MTVEIPLEEFQKLILEENPVERENILQNIVNKYQVTYVKVISKLYELVGKKEYDRLMSNKIEDKKEIKLNENKIEEPKKILFTDLKFCKIRRGTKKPYEEDWPNKPYTWDEIQEHIQKEVNYGILCGYEGLIVIDADTPELRDFIQKNMPKTFTVKTGGEAGGMHFYYICPEVKKKIILTKEKHFGEIQSWGTQCVGPGSIHVKTGRKYEIIDENNKIISEIDYATLFSAIKPFSEDIKAKEAKTLEELEELKKSNKIPQDSDINSINIISVIPNAGFRKANNGEYYGPNPWHGCILSQDCEIFTPDGIKKIVDIKKGDKIFNQNNNLTKVINIFKHKYSGKSYIFKCGFPEVKFTAEHPILVCNADFYKKHRILKGKETAKVEWKRADKITTRDNIVIPKWLKKRHKTKIKGVQLTNSLAYILGKYIADGSINNRQRWKKYKTKKTREEIKLKDGFNYQINITINEKKLKQAKKILLEAKKLNIYGSIYYEKRKHALRITLFSKWLVKFILNTIGIYSENKKIGVLTSAPKNFLNIMIKAYYENDGHFANGHQRVSSASEILIKEIQDILFQLGTPNRYCKYNDIGKSKTKYSTNALSWWPGKVKQTSYFEDDYYYYIRIKEIITNDEEMVWCYNIETTDKTFRVPFVVHNSTTGINFWINPAKNVAHCFRCDCGINVAQAIALENGIISSCDNKLTKEQFLEVLKIAQDKYGLKPLEKEVIKEEIKVIEEKEAADEAKEVWKEITRIIFRYYPKPIIDEWYKESFLTAGIDFSKNREIQVGHGTIVKGYVKQVIEKTFRITNLARNYGFEVWDNKSDCPFCGAENKMSYNDANNLFKCWGEKCNAQGDLMEFVRRMIKKNERKL